jgi:hypothetical protein
MDLENDDRPRVLVTSPVLVGLFAANAAVVGTVLVTLACSIVINDSFVLLPLAALLLVGSVGAVLATKPFWFWIERSGDDGALVVTTWSLWSSRSFAVAGPSMILLTGGALPRTVFVTTGGEKVKVDGVTRRLIAQCLGEVPPEP